MKTLKIIAAATILAASTSANAWFGPFDNNGYGNNGYNNNGYGNGAGNGAGDFDGDFDTSFSFGMKAKGRGNG